MFMNNIISFMRPPCRINHHNFVNSSPNRLSFSGKQLMVYWRPNSTLPQHSLTNTSEEVDCLYKTLKVEIRSGEPAVLSSYSWFTTHAAKLLGITIGSCWTPPKAHHDRLTLLKSVHIYKKHRVQYEVRTYYRHMTFHNLTGSTADTFMEYVQRNLPEGVAMKVTKTSIQQLPTPVKKFTNLLI